MEKRLTKVDYILWTAIAIYSGIIYATLSIVSKIRKFLSEKYGPNVFDTIYWVFGVIAVVFIFFFLRKFRGKQLLQKLLIFLVFVGIYAYYLSGMKYPVERIHFLEYGILGSLIYFAMTRHIHHWFAVIFSMHVVYWIGLGDEAIQWALPSRVGEIRDSVINLFSGALGIVLLVVNTERLRRGTVLTSSLSKAMILFTGATTIVTALFIFFVHGFGFQYETKTAGRVYTALSTEQLEKINARKPDVSENDLAVYENEAQRHLFQREFYFTNEFKAVDGTFYKVLIYSMYENRILESHYRRFMEDHAHEKSGPLCAHIGKEVAQKVMDNPLQWPDSLRIWMDDTYKNDNGIYTSRVKSGIITSFYPKDLLFYCMIIFLILVYMWVRIPRE